MKSIPAGYRLIVTSWENDADNYNTEYVQGLSLAATKFLVDVIKLFYSKNNRTKPYKCFGNMYEPSDGQQRECFDAIQAIMDKHADALKDDTCLSDYIESPGAVHEYLYELGLVGGEFWTRVLSSFEVEHYPQEVIINDVTDQFN